MSEQKKVYLSINTVVVKFLFDRILKVKTVQCEIYRCLWEERCHVYFYDLFYSY